jgi:hypothetical protein
MLVRAGFRDVAQARKGREGAVFSGEERAWWERRSGWVLRDVTHERKGREGVAFSGEEHAWWERRSESVLRDVTQEETR